LLTAALRPSSFATPPSRLHELHEKKTVHASRGRYEMRSNSRKYGQEVYEDISPVNEEEVAFMRLMKKSLVMEATSLRKAPYFP